MMTTKEDLKQNRFYVYLNDGRIAWVDKHMIHFGGMGLNREIYIEESDKFMEIGRDCNYNQLMRKCRVEPYYFQINNINSGQLN